MTPSLPLHNMPYFVKSPLPSPHQSGFISYQSPWKYIPHLILIKHIWFTPPIEILYYSWNQAIPQNLLLTPNTSNYRHNSQMGSGAFVGMFALSHTPCMSLWCCWNYTYGEIQIKDRRTKNVSWVIIINKIIIIKTNGWWQKPNQNF